MKGLSKMAEKRKSNLLDDEIRAVLATAGRPLGAREIAARCPSAAQTHDVSLRLIALKRSGVIVASGSSARPLYRLARPLSPDRSAIQRVAQLRGRTFSEDAPPDTEALRGEIVALLAREARPMTRDEIYAKCESARSPHEVSQQLHALVREGRIIPIDGDRKRLYCVAPSMQHELDFEPAPSGPERSGSRPISISFGAAEQQIIEPRKGIRIAFDGRGKIASIVIDADLVAS